MNTPSEPGTAIPVTTPVAEPRTVQITQKRTLSTRMIRTDVYFGPTKLATIKAGQSVTIRAPGEGMLTLNSSKKFYPHMGSILLLIPGMLLLGPLGALLWYIGGQKQSLTVPVYQNAPTHWRVEYNRKYKMTVIPEG